MRSRPLRLLISCLLVVFAGALVGSDHALATNGGTTSGNESGTDCAVVWKASSVMDSDLTNDDPQYPGLMTDREGQPVHYVNGGYITEVSPAFGDPGLLELNHFYTGSGATLTQVWRLPIATDKAMDNVEVTVTLPPEVRGRPVTFDAVSTNSTIGTWGPTYARYQWAERATATDNGDGTWTAKIGHLDPRQATVFQLNVALDATYQTTDRFVATATLTASSLAGTCGFDLDAIPVPQPTPNLGVCQVEFLGRTIWNPYDPDISVRDKYQGGVPVADISDPAVLGEVNTDGWGADGWAEGSTRTMRPYGATKVPLTNVSYRVDAIQGATFTGEATEYRSPGLGQLHANGFTQPIDAWPVTLTPTSASGNIATMGENSSFSFNVTVTLDGSNKPIVLFHRAIGDLVGCDPSHPVEPTPSPTPTTTPSVPTTTTPTPTPTPGVPPVRLPNTGM